MAGRCFLVYALAPEGTTAREANDRLNEYVAERRRGLAVWHDHFGGGHGRRGGAVVLVVRSEEERALLNDPGPLAGWRLAVPPADLLALRRRLRRADHVHARALPRRNPLEHLAAAEPADPRFWWQRRKS